MIKCTAIIVILWVMNRLSFPWLSFVSFLLNVPPPEFDGFPNCITEVCLRKLTDLVSSSYLLYSKRVCVCSCFM